MERGEAFEGRVKLARTFVLLVTLSVLLIGNKEAIWPIVSWDMYSNAGRFKWTTETEELELTLVTASGRRIVVPADQLLGPERDVLVRKTIRAAFEDGEVQPARRAWLARAGARFAGEALHRIECHHLRFVVHPDRSPVFDRSQPDERTRVGAFEVTNP